METLLNLEKKLAEWARLPPEEQQAGNKTAAILELGGTVKDGLSISLDACTRAAVLRMKFHTYHHKLARIINHYPWPQEISLALQGCLNSLEEDYPDLIDPDETLPRHEKEILVQLVDRHLPVVCRAIEERKLPHVYADEIRSAFRALFDEDKLPELTYRHKRYIPQLIRASLRLGAEKVSRRWKQHLLELFVNYNFNFMGIYNRWKELRDAEFAAAAEKGEEEACWWAWKETISHYNPKRGMAFDPHNDSLLSHMERYLVHRKALIDFTSILDPGREPTKLLTKLLNGDLAVRFHYFYLLGDYDYGKQQQAADDFVAVHLTKRGNKASTDMLTKFDKEILLQPARRFYFLLRKICKMLEKDFKIKNTDDE